MQFHGSKEVNFCVVKATALVLVDSNKTPYLREFEPTMTSRNPLIGAAILLTELEQPLVLQFPEGCLKNVNLYFLLTLTR